MDPSHTVSVIVPFHNEELSIVHTAQVLTSLEYIAEVIFVNDCSTDGSLEKLYPYLNKIALYNLPKHAGKTAAVLEGIKNAHGEILIFLDADLETLNESHIRNLLKPLTEENCDGSVGYPSETVIDYLFIPLGGQRAYYRKDVVEVLPKLEKAKHYGLETALNAALSDKNIKVFSLPGLGHRNKFHKKRKNKEMLKETTRWVHSVGTEYLRQGVDSATGLIKNPE